MIMSDKHLHVYMYIPSLTHFIIIIIIIIISVSARCPRSSLFVERRDGLWRLGFGDSPKYRFIYKLVFQWTNGESL